MDADDHDPDREAEPERRGVAGAIHTAGTMIDGGRRRATAGLRSLEARRERSPALDVMFRAIDRDRKIHGGTFAAALAFRFFLFLLPVTLVIIVVLSFVLDADPASSRELVDRFGVRGALAEALIDATNQGRANRWWALAVGLVGTGWASLGCVRGLRLASALAWERRIQPLTRPHVAVGAFVGVYVAVFAAPLVAGWARALFGIFGDVTGAIGVLVLYTCLWTVVVRMLPHGVSDWRYLFPGAFLLAIGTEVIQLVTAYFFAPRLEHSASVYGAVGVAAVILTWLFLIARLLISAAVINAVLDERRRHAHERRRRRANGGPVGGLPGSESSQ